MSITMAPRKIDGKAHSIRDILKKGIQYRVPTYQRDFAWSSDDIETLWEDIDRAMSGDKKEYFLGAIVTSYTIESKKLEIVDGQQRLATISMFYAAIAKAWKSRNNDSARSEGVRIDFLGDVDRRSMGVTPKLTLNENNNSFFQEYVIGEKNLPLRERKSIISSNKLIIDGYEKVQRLLDDLLDKNPTEEGIIDRLVKLEDFISDAIYAILIETGDESDAFLTFETLNDRGLDLATSDLVKNLLFSKAGKLNIESFKNTWAEIVVIIGSDALTKFIRYFWNAYYDIVREIELYKSIKNIIKDLNDAKVMLDKLRKAANHYDAISNENNTYWLETPPEYKNYIRALNLFKVSQYRPILLAAMASEDMSKNDLVKVMKIITIISFRFTIISSLNTGNLEKVYSKAALEIIKNPKVKPGSIFKLLKSVYVDDDKFEADFKQKIFNKDPIARYALRELNSEMMPSGEITASESLTLEHILPKNPSPDWLKYTGGKKVEDIVYLIGNLTLLESTKNKGIGNSDFENKKINAFKSSALALNDSVKEEMFWSGSDKVIEKRSAVLASVARKRWRLDY